MDPSPWWWNSAPAAAPRARGDGPGKSRKGDDPSPCSPRTRGWTQVRPHEVDGVLLLPAHAGMDPWSASARVRPGAAPRARGDGPGTPVWRGSPPGCSPRTRGWTHAVGGVPKGPRLLPAHAGMDPQRLRRPRTQPPAPRARGDGPRSRRRRSAEVSCSPRTRGWTRSETFRDVVTSLLPAHAGMDPHRPVGGRARPPAPRARGDGPHTTRDPSPRGYCSPRTRGWTRSRRPPNNSTPLLPAHAGMDPVSPESRRKTSTAPRARGDGPVSTTVRMSARDCSPRTRGWTRCPPRRRHGRRLLPAHAGMDPAPDRPGPSRRPAPRARGDGPSSEVMRRRASSCSPRTRGWTHESTHGTPATALLPAHAGMDPCPRRCACRRGTAPRARGDGPAKGSVRTGATDCSPRTRGWTLG